MDTDPELEMSPLCGPIRSGNRSVEVHIYRLVGDSGWILEVVDEHDNSTVWDDPFDSDSAALTEAKKSILQETISAFIGPEDGKPSANWK